MAAKSGSLSINSENIFPIIKKWLYSDHDIFYRELISNGCDAVTKLKKLDMMGEYSLPEGYKGRVDVIVDPEKKTLTFKDNGLGMTADEVEEYINQIAFSGATDFIEKYKDKSNSDQIIGHFGLGFYSAFMVADEVHIDTLSYKDGAKAVHWECDGGTEFSMEDGDKTDVGTTITLFLNEDCLEFCNEYKAREVVKKYCSFMPTEIYLSKANTKETQIIKEEEKLPDDEVLEEIEPEKKEKTEGENAEAEAAEEPKKLKIRKRPELINETQPLWTRHPNECTKEEYLDGPGPLSNPPVPRRTGSGGGGPELAAGLPCSDRHLGGPGGPGIHRPRASGVGRRPLPLPCGGEPFRGAHLHRPEMEKRHRRLLVHPLHRPPEPIRPLGRLYRGRGGDFVGRGKKAEPREAGTRKSPENNESSFLPAAAEKASAAALFCQSAGRRAAADVSKKFFELTCQVSRPSFVL